MNRGLILTVVLLAACYLTPESGIAQSTYHLQRASLFEALAGDSTDIIFLGNSITDGGNWAELFGDLRVKNRGISADISSGVLDRLDVILKNKPAKIFLMIGVNDLARGIEVPAITANYEEIISRVKTESPQSRLYLQSVLPVNPELNMFPDHTNKSREISQLNWQLRRLAKLNGLTYVDLWSEFVDTAGILDTAYTNDGLHLTGQGYILWRDLVKELVFE